ncbi:MAG: AFG1/ZapE family ATPase, partial [Alphaproteobacteria bacterium]
MASRIAAGELSPDGGQKTVADALDSLIDEIAAGTRRRWLPLRRAAQPRGLYIHGGVGRGKTMLMDMFHDALA